MKKKLRIFMPIVILIIIAVGIYVFKVNKVSDELTLYGNIENRTVDTGFRVEGRVKKLLKEEGDTVKKGELIAFLDSVKYEALYKKSLSDIDAAEAYKDNAMSLFSRNEMLCQDGTTSPQECDRLQNQQDEAIAKFEAAIEQSKIAKDNLENAKIYSPCDGIVTTRVVEEGTVIMPSSPVYTIAISEPVWIRTYVSEKDLGNIKYQMNATILTDSVDPQTNQKRQYSGYIGYISPIAEFTPKTVQTTDLRTDLVYRIRVYVDKTDEFLRQGMPVTVKIELIPSPDNSENFETQNNPLGITESENAINGY